MINYIHEFHSKLAEAIDNKDLDKLEACGDWLENVVMDQTEHDALVLLFGAVADMLDENILNEE